MTSILADRPRGTADAGRGGTDDVGGGGHREMSVRRRDGAVTRFDPERISLAITKAFLAVDGEAAGQSTRLRRQVVALTDAVVDPLRRRYGTPPGGVARPVDVEQIQDQVELELMRGGHAAVARAYILYREEHRRARLDRAAAAPTSLVRAHAALHVVNPAGESLAIDEEQLRSDIAAACDGVPDVDAARVWGLARGNLYDGMRVAELRLVPVLAARGLVESDPGYSRVAARLLAGLLRDEAIAHVTGEQTHVPANAMGRRYADYFRRYLRHGIGLGQIDPALGDFDLGRLGEALDAGRDLDFTYLSLQTLYDRYLLHDRGVRYELPQAFFMRVAMGLALHEIDRDEWAIEFYRLLTSFDFMCSTPTLFNAGTTRPQLSSCFLTTVPDQLEGIFSSVRDNALLAKYSGGIGNDWTPVRGIGAHIRGTNGKSLGIVPFLKIANDTAVAVNQGGKRKGAVCAYLEVWHVDIEEFLDLRRNTGDERRRTHDMNTAVWVPDELVRRVEADEAWTLFSPDEVPDLHELYGQAFSERYAEYEEAADRGEITVFRRMPAKDLWRRILTMLFETGHPWMTFKDACNVRSPQRHVGVVHSSNLCTEITLNTSAGSTEGEVAVCNLGSVNLAAHVVDGRIDAPRLRCTVRTAVRMLDNVIDINLYTIPAARRSNLRHRPVGLGLMGFVDALYRQGIGYASEAAVEFADESMELISYYAIEASVDLAVERGRYASFDGSLWSRGVLPIDSVALLGAERRGDLAQDTLSRLDWDALRERVVRQGMRNSNLMAIAPTATISNIVGVSQSIEPTYRNLYVKANMSGNFTVVNDYLVAELKARGLWDEVMAADLKYFDGVLAEIERVPADLKERFATAFEIDGGWLVAAASRRQKWLDQAQSTNLYMANPSGRALDELYRAAWRAGLKTTYYLRSTSATHVEKSTLNNTDGRLNAVRPVAFPPGMAPTSAHGTVPDAEQAALAAGSDQLALERDPTGEPSLCSILDPDCAACQ